MEKISNEHEDTSVIINNAGNTADNLILRMKTEQWNEIINLNQIISVNLIHLIKNDVFKKVIPSKMFESMAMKKAIILGVDGESKN